jgi:tetratricopeptide (TPR) repeat protein
VNEPEHSVDAEIRAHKIDTLVRTANIHVMRNHLSEAVSACQEALALDPDNPDVHELLADVLAQQGKRQAAIAEYRAVFEAHPDRVSAERKMAQLSLQMGEQQRLLELQRELVDDPSKRKHMIDRTRIAALSSVLLPGLGQLCLGAYFKGAALLVFTLALLYYILQKVLLQPLGTLVGEMGTPGAGWGGAIAHVSGYALSTKLLILGACFLVLGAYAYGIIDTVRMARAQQDQLDEQLGI